MQATTSLMSTCSRAPKGEVRGKLCAGAPAWGQGTCSVLLVFGSAVLPDIFSPPLSKQKQLCRRLASVRRLQPLGLSRPMLQSPAKTSPETEAFYRHKVARRRDPAKSKKSQKNSSKMPSSPGQALSGCAVEHATK